MVDLATANIKSNPVMRQSYVQSDIRKVASMAGVILWQEIAPDRYKAAVANLTSYEHKHMQLESPISLKKRYWEVLDFGYKQTNHGRKAVTPSRYIVWVKARRRGTDKVVIFMNSHFISGAFNRKYALTTLKWRKSRWNHHYAMFKAMVMAFNAAGYTVIGGGDWNKGNTPKFTAQQRWIAKGGIDHLFVSEAPNGAVLNLTEMDVEPDVHTDHSPRLARFTLSKSVTYQVPTKLPDFSAMRAL